MTKDQIGKRGESLFTAMITRPCYNRMWFIDTFMGAKYPTIDFYVDLIDPTVERPFLYVQVKATNKGYFGPGAARKLNIKVTKRDIQRLKRIPGPTYVVGIDVVEPYGKGYIIAIDKSITGAINGLPTKNRLDCTTIQKLWNEVDTYWKAKDMLMRASTFSLQKGEDQ